MLFIVVWVLLGYRFLCLVNGSFFIYIVFIKNFVVLVNIFYIVIIFFNEEGNYSCVVNNKYGVDIKYFYVVFNGKCIL